MTVQIMEPGWSQVTEEMKDIYEEVETILAGAE